MNQYIVQNYTQIIDLFDNMDTTKSLAIELKSDIPFGYAFVSREQLDNTDFSTLQMTETVNLTKVITAAQRYLVAKAKQQTVLSVSRKVTTNVAEMFGVSSVGDFIKKIFSLLFTTLIVLAILYGIYRVYGRYNPNSPVVVNIGDFLNKTKTAIDSKLHTYSPQSTNSSTN